LRSVEVEKMTDIGDFFDDLSSITAVGVTRRYFASCRSELKRAEKSI
jgi:hypothetical protein